MPNWACGCVSVLGTKKNVKKFVSRFIFDEEINNKQGKGRRFFARSFVNNSKKAVIKDINSLFKDHESNVEDTFSLSIDFAWSAHSCLIEGYPQDNPQCITLSEACQTDHVSVEIETEEGGMCFEESIACDKNGNVESESTDMQSYQCKHCGNTMAIPSFYDRDDYECCECGNCGWEEDTKNEENSPA